MVRCSPLYHSATLLRELTTGTVGLELAACTWRCCSRWALVGMVVTGRRLEKLLLT